MMLIMENHKNTLRKLCSLENDVLMFTKTKKNTARKLCSLENYPPLLLSIAPLDDHCLLPEHRELNFDLVF